MSHVVLCISTTHVGESTIVESGRLYMSDDPVVRAHPELFDSELEKYAVGYQSPTEPTVESGEVRRGPGRPRKVVA